MFRFTVLSLALVAALVAGHDGHTDDHSAIVYTTVMVMNGMTTTMAMTAAASEDSSATDVAAPSTTASPGLALPTNAPAHL